MAQLLLDPQNVVSKSSWKPSGPIPAKVRKFGHFPNIDDWLPGDLLLISSIRPPWISRQIIAAQTRGGYSMEDARWHHAAMYIGDANICEATASGVNLVPIFDYVGTHKLRLRRDPLLTDKDRFRLAVKALARLRNSYSQWSVLKLYARSFPGFWHDSGDSVSFFGASAVICSQLYADAYAMATSKLITSVPSVQVTPAALSETSELTDVALHWNSIG
jgi:hypothetical protein